MVDKSALVLAPTAAQPIPAARKRKECGMMISDLGLKPKIGTLDDARRKASERYLV